MRLVRYAYLVSLPLRVEGSRVGGRPKTACLPPAEPSQLVPKSAAQKTPNLLPARPLCTTMPTLVHMSESSV